MARRDRTGEAATAPPAGSPPAGSPPASRLQRSYRLRSGDGKGRWTEDEVVSEFPLTLVVNGHELATLTCSPTHLDELAVGFLTAEGVLRRGERITRLFVDREAGVAHLDAPDREGALEQEMFGVRYVGSCCGKSRTGFYFANDARTARVVEADLELETGDCFRLMGELEARSELFQRTGGVHAAGLATRKGVEAVRIDIGRHNTLDKLYGWALGEEVPLEERLVVFSGRISSEIVLKISKMGCPALVSKSAPTALALEMADDLGITTVGFLRPGKLNVYTHAERVRDVPPAPRGEG